MKRKLSKKSDQLINEHAQTMLAGAYNPTKENKARFNAAEIALRKRMLWLETKVANQHNLIDGIARVNDGLNKTAMAKEIKTAQRTGRGMYCKSMLTGD